MNPDRIDHHLSPVTYAQLVDTAKAHALEARREAINAFWSAVVRRVGAAWAGLRRVASATRAQRASWV